MARVATTHEPASSSNLNSDRGLACKARRVLQSELLLYLLLSTDGLAAEEPRILRSTAANGRSGIHGPPPLPTLPSAPLRCPLKERPDRYKLHKLLTILKGAKVSHGYSHHLEDERQLQPVLTRSLATSCMTTVNVKLLLAPAQALYHEGPELLRGILDTSFLQRGLHFGGIRACMRRKHWEKKTRRLAHAASSAMFLTKRCRKLVALIDTHFDALARTLNILLGLRRKMLLCGSGRTLGLDATLVSNPIVLGPN